MRVIFCRLLPVVLILGLWIVVAAAAAPQRTVSARTPVFSYRDQVLAEDTTWRGEVLVEGGVTIAPQATLTVEPGTVVRFRRADGTVGGGAALLVRGRILANGSKEKPVLFTSAYDGAVAGDWDGIVLLASEKKNLLEHCRVEGAVTGCEVLFSSLTLKHVRFTTCGTGAEFKDSSAVISGGGASDCVTGMVLRESEVDLREAGFTGNRRGVVAAGTSLFLSGTTFSGNGETGLVADGCRLRVTGSSFADNGSGLRLTSCEGGIAASRIEKNAGDGLFLDRSRMKVNGNEISRNGKAGLRVTDGGSVAWGNSLGANGEYDLCNDGSDDFTALGNWWGGVPASGIGQRIYGGHQDGSRGKVRFIPYLTESATTGL
ncbi:right-handed parallel beta-helix repeat-containing protein [Geobacter sp. AOG1]|uniref:right-handed parallel beta-helix repeat-containing protein n=1 Tax=Geobacter sp. AOG1 TaxID=1566346 RepID=UPI001CC3B43F|nr:right-handed parallel beta-helix repeat-containing protein [Geobacter sp. AOG1]GFE58817.1 hypothetical protein AOG1_26970 [Geobacter sp. AOG1]